MSTVEPNPSTSLEDWPEVQILTDLDQVKVLADPLRLRILEALCEQPRTTKQVASTLGEKTTKLYHHVDALERAGLIVLTETRQKRGTLEKYYRAVARSFRAAGHLFSSTSDSGTEPGAWQEVAATVLENAASDARGLSDSDVANMDDPDEALALFAGIKIRASKAAIAELQAKLESWLEEAQAADADSGEVYYRAVLAYYPAGKP